MKQENPMSVQQFVNEFKKNLSSAKVQDVNKENVAIKVVQATKGISPMKRTYVQAVQSYLAEVKMEKGEVSSISYIGTPTVAQLCADNEVKFEATVQAILSKEKKENKGATTRSSQLELKRKCYDDFMTLFLSGTLFEGNESEEAKEEPAEEKESTEVEEPDGDEVASDEFDEQSLSGTYDNGSDFEDDLPKNDDTFDEF